MAKVLADIIDSESQQKIDKFLSKIESDMHFKADFSGDLMSFDWVDEIEFACPYIDNVVRKPKLTLIQEENVVKVERSKKITVASIKDLSRHTNYIKKVDKQTNEVEPEKILDIRNEETFNIYENRFLYTLINDLSRFLLKKEKQLDNFEITNNRLLEYAAATETKEEKINIEVKLTSESIPDEAKDKKLEEQLKSIKYRVKRIREYITSWEKSEMYTSLEKAHVHFILPPVKKTNIILKNPNFQIAVKLWDYIRTYDYVDRDDSKDNLEADGRNNLRGFLDHSFLIDYFVLDSIAKTKKEQKEKMAKYAILMLTQEIKRTVNLLLSCGLKMTDEELLKLIAKELKDEKNNRLVGVDDVKKKFKSAMDEYLERTQNYL